MHGICDEARTDNDNFRNHVLPTTFFFETDDLFDVIKPIFSRINVRGQIIARLVKVPGEVKQTVNYTMKGVHFR